MTDTPYLRSINIAQDSAHPGRISHFRPTAKCVGLIHRLLGEQQDRAYFVVAPYGSGKSLACTYLLHLIENRPQEDAQTLLKTVEDRLKEVDPKLARFAHERAKTGQAGLVIVLEGNVSNAAEALQSAALSAMKRCKRGREARSIGQVDTKAPQGLVNVVTRIAEKAQTAKFDRVAIVWDEFGRHLEGLVSSGRAAELADVQLLAETASRVTALPVTLGVVMHQGFANYAGSLPQAARSEWKKVEGRFSPVQYVDDSIELYELLGSIVSSLRRGVPPVADWGKRAGVVKKAGLFTAFADAKLTGLLQASWPVDPAVVYLLPKLAARTAQNERTMFGFLYSQVSNDAVGLNDLYEYFAPTMELDRGVGGTYRAWLETESACAKANTATEVLLLRLTSLLTIAFSEDRERLTPRVLEDIACLSGMARRTVKSAVKTLVERKLLLHRRHANQISLWHGTDLDLKGRLETEISRVAEGFELETFISNEFPPPVWKPVRYNDEISIRRFFRSRFVSASELRGALQGAGMGGLAPDDDGEVWYIIPSTSADSGQARQAIEEADPDPRLVFAIPSEVMPLREPALELVALQHLQTDDQLTAEDPLAANEIGQMIDDVQKHLTRLIDQFVIPGQNSIHWLNDGDELDVSSPSELREALSMIAAKNFPKTPIINSEMINRRQPSAAIVNARKKVCLGILERYGQEKLGLEGEFADSAIFRSVLNGTRLYRRDVEEDTWRFARPDELEDPRLATIWRRFEEFFTATAKSPKRVSDLLVPLTRRPIGLRAGLLPILFAAATRAFPSTASILRRDGSYVADLLPSEVEAICKEPQNYLISVPELSANMSALLEGLRHVFQSDGSKDSGELSIIRELHEAIEDWVHTLPTGALTSKLISSEGRSFQRALRAVGDPQRLLLKELPAIGRQSLEVGERVAEIAKHKHELESLGEQYARDTARIVSRSLHGAMVVSNQNSLDALKEWRNIIPAALETAVKGKRTANMLRTLVVPYTSESAMAEKIGLLCTGKTFRHWSDETVREFREVFVRNLNELESEAIELPGGGKETFRAFMLRSRLGRLAEELAAISSTQEASAYLSSISKQMLQKAG